MEDLFQHFYLRMVTILFISYAKRRISSNEFGQVSLEYPYLFLHPRKLNVHALDMDARSSRTANASASSGPIQVPSAVRLVCDEHVLVSTVTISGVTSSVVHRRGRDPTSDPGGGGRLLFAVHADRLRHSSAGIFLPAYALTRFMSVRYATKMFLTMASATNLQHEV